MKTWLAPDVEELNINKTAQGRNMSNNFDEIRVDQNSNYWVSFSSGADSQPEITGSVTVN